MNGAILRHKVSVVFHVKCIWHYLCSSRSQYQNQFRLIATGQLGNSNELWAKCYAIYSTNSYWKLYIYMHYATYFEASASHWIYIDIIPNYAGLLSIRRSKISVIFYIKMCMTLYLCSGDNWYIAMQKKITTLFFCHQHSEYHTMIL